MIRLQINDTISEQLTHMRPDLQHSSITIIFGIHDVLFSPYEDVNIIKSVLGPVFNGDNKFANVQTK